MRVTATSVAIVLGFGCTQWSTVPVSEVTTGKTEVRTRLARIEDDVGRVQLRIDRVGGSVLEGWDASERAELRIDLSRIRSLEVEMPDRAATGAAVFGATMSGVVVLSLVFLAYLFSNAG